jgi:hypothetical protein
MSVYLLRWEAEINFLDINSLEPQILFMPHRQSVLSALAANLKKLIFQYILDGIIFK